MNKYSVTGMSCAACQARVEKAVSALPGVDSCAVSLLTNSMGVEGSADPETIIKAVKDAGYGAELIGGGSAGRGKTRASDYEDELTDTESPKIKRRLIASVILLLPLMYVSMGHMMWGFPVPEILMRDHMFVGIYEMVLASLVAVINRKFFISGTKGLMHASPNMDTLVAMGSAASFIYSIYALIAGEHELYFESAAMILTLITVGKYLEAKSKGKTTDALKSLMKLAAKTATIIKDGEEKEVPIEEVSVGDRFVVRPGQNIPVDGIVIEGDSAVNEAALTGESIPVDKTAGDNVSAATVNLNGHMICKAVRVGEDTTLSQIIRLVSDAATTKAPIAKVADRVSGVFVPVVIGIALVTLIIWLAAGETFGFALARAISVLVISCPCALGLATPVAIMVGNGVGAKNGILFKTSVSLEETGKMQFIALDKTGTITRGEPEVVGVYEGKGINRDELVTSACSVEVGSEHPLAKAIVEYGKKNGVRLSAVSDFIAKPGNGLSAKVNGVAVYGGNREYIQSIIGDIDSSCADLANELADKGQTPLFFAREDKLLGIISVADVVKDDSVDAIRDLKNLGLHVVMLTGDNKRTAAAIAHKIGVDEYVAEVKPDGKEEIIRRLAEYGKVVMVGDGINDAPALTRADIGIAIGAGTDVAIDAADVVLVKSSLKDVAAAIRLSRATLKNIHENLFWAFFYNAACIPLAAGLYIKAFGWTLDPMIGAAAMSLSSFCVVMNALRLNGCKLHSKDKDKPGSKPVKNLDLTGITDNDSKEPKDKEETNKMDITVKGMMCAHCEAHVKEALEKIDGVVSATADHEKDLVTLQLSGEVSKEDIKAAVEGAGYEYVG